HSLQARAADLVDRHRRDAVVQPTAQPRLARRILAQAGLHDIAHDDFIHLLGFNPGATHGLCHDLGAKLRCRQGSEAALELSDGTADRAQNDRVFHDEFSLRRPECDRWLVGRSSTPPGSRAKYRRGAGCGQFGGGGSTLREKFGYTPTHCAQAARRGAGAPYQHALGRGRREVTHDSGASKSEFRTGNTTSFHSRGLWREKSSTRTRSNWG